MRFINSKIHGLLDYAAAITLIIAPFVLGLQYVSPLAHWISVFAGIGLVVYSLVTDYYFSVSKLIPFKLHLGLDFVAAVFFLVAPLFLGFEGVAKIYFWVMGAGVLMVIAFTSAVESKSSADSVTRVEARA